MRCYFHLLSDETIIPDEEGLQIESADLHAVLRTALSEIRREQPQLFTEVSDWRLSVCNVLDEVIISIPLRDHAFADTALSAAA